MFGCLILHNTSRAWWSSSFGFPQPGPYKSQPPWAFQLDLFDIPRWGFPWLLDPSGKRYLIPICSFALRKKSPSFVYHMEDIGHIRSYPKYYTGWWYTYPSEKWWSSSVGMIIPNTWKHKINVPNHQPVILHHPFSPSKPYHPVNPPFSSRYFPVNSQLWRFPEIAQIVFRFSSHIPCCFFPFSSNGVETIINHPSVYHKRVV